MPTIVAAPLAGILALFILICAVPVFSADISVEADLARAIQLRDKHREVEALQLFEQILEQEPDNYQALLNAGYLHFRQGWLYTEKGTEEQKHHFRKLSAYAERARLLAPAEYRAILLHLVAKAKISSFLPPGDQVRIVRELHRDLPQLIASAGNDPVPIYIFSWLNLKVGAVGSFERMLAAMLFGGLPDDLTVERAVRLMERAIEMRPDYSVYYYDLGLFRQRLGQDKEARALFEKVVAMEQKTPEDAVYRRWAEQRLTEVARDEK